MVTRDSLKNYYSNGSSSFKEILSMGWELLRVGALWRKYGAALLKWELQNAFGGRIFDSILTKTN